VVAVSWYERISFLEMNVKSGEGFGSVGAVETSTTTMSSLGEV